MANPTTLAPAGGNGLSASLTSRGDDVVLELAGELRRATLPALEAQIDQLMCTDCRHLEIEVARLRVIDRTGLRLLISLRTYLRGRGATVSLRRGPPRLGPPGPAAA